MPTKVKGIVSRGQATMAAPKDVRCAGGGGGGRKHGSCGAMGTRALAGVGLVVALLAPGRTAFAQATLAGAAAAAPAAKPVPAKAAPTSGPTHAPPSGPTAPPPVPAPPAPPAVPLPGAVGFVPAPESTAPSGGAQTPAASGAPSPSEPASSGEVMSPYPPGQAPPPPPWPGYNGGAWGPNAYGPNPNAAPPYGQASQGGYAPPSAYPPPGYSYTPGAAPQSGSAQPQPPYGQPPYGPPPEGQAYGQPPYGQQPDGPPASPYGPPPGYPWKPLVQEHTHTGLYFGASLGFSYLHLESSRVNGEKTGVNGGGLGFSLALGGAIVRNVLLFGSLSLHAGAANNATGALKMTTDTSAKEWGLAAFTLGGGLRYYFDPDNFFLEGTLTFPTVSLSRQEDKAALQDAKTLKVTKTGVGFEGRVGKEWWVSTNWGLGVAGWASIAGAAPDGETTPQVAPSGGTTTVEDTNKNYTVWGLGLAFSASYN